MNQIGCDVAMDLMPLVEDGVASHGTCVLLHEHMAACLQCKARFGNPLPVDMDDAAVVGKIKKQMVYVLVSIMLIGTLFGLAISDSMDLFYNALVMPAIGVLGYLLLKRKAYWVVLGMFTMSVLWVIVRELFNGYMDMTEILMTAGVWAVIFAGFTVVGIAIGWLLTYAFRNEGTK